MKQLDFTLSLIDKLTRPLKQAQASVTGFAEKSQAAFGKIAVGGAALVGVGLSIKGALGPAIEMTDALNSAATKGIDDKTLQKVAGDALAFSARYGKSATEFIGSTEAIRSQVARLSNDELPAFAVATNTLAAAVKGSAAEAAEYMGSMYNKFDSYAEKIGRVEFAEQVAGKTAYMAQAFGTSMQTISDLMEGAKGVGSNYGVGLDEQFAVLGQLEKTLGTEASGSYESFYKVAQQGAKQLGLSFMNASGQMLTMPQMLEKLQAKYGASIEGNLKAQAELDKAFGDGANVIKQLYGNVDILNRHINTLGSSDGMKRATEMAHKMANPWERLTAIWYSIRAAMGLTLLPVLYPLINKMADAGQVLVRWAKLFPNLARAIGMVVVAFLGLAAVGAITNIVLGVTKFIVMGLRALWVGFTAILRIHIAAIWLYQKAVLAWSAVMRMLRGVLLAVRIASVLTGIAFNFMSWPILLIVGAIALLGVGCYLLIQHWDAVKAAIMETEAFKVLAAVVEWVGGVFAEVWAWVAEGWEQLCAYFKGFSLADAFTGMVDSVGKMFSGLWASVRKVFAETYNWIIDKLNMLPGISIDAMAVDVVANVPETLTGQGSIQPVKVPTIEAGTLPTGRASIAGVEAVAPSPAVTPVAVPQPVPALMAPNSMHGSLPEKMRDRSVVPGAPQGRGATPAPNVSVFNVPQPPQVKVIAAAQPDKAKPAALTGNTLITGGKLKGIGPGGLSKDITNNTRTVTDNSKQIRIENINVKQGMTPEQLMEWQELN